MMTHEPAPAADRSLVSRLGALKDVYVLLVLISASVVGARILSVPGALGPNDTSRWATVRALVETGSYVVGRREMYDTGSYHDLGIIFQRDWGTVDVVLDPATHRFYSSKPTLLPTLLAAEYWFLREAFSLHFRRSRTAIIRTILLTVNLLPFVFYLLLFGRLIDRLGTTDWGRLYVFAAAGFGTYVSAYLASLNNHTVAAMGALFAVYHCLCIQLEDDRRPSRFVLAGVFAGWTACNDLPAATLACGVMLWLLRLSPRDALRLALPGMLVPVGAYLFTQYLAVGSVLPTYAHKSWYEFAGSYWRNPGGVDRLQEPKLQYAVNLLVGHTGIFSMMPVVLLGWIGMIRTTLGLGGRRAEPGASSHRVVAVLTLILTVITFVFYVLRTENYGGVTAGPRWFIWLVPLWLLTMLPVVDRWALDWRTRWLASALLALSIGSASYALVNPWRHSWLVVLFRHWGIVTF